MEQVSNLIKVAYTDPAINSRLAGLYVPRPSSGPAGASASDFSSGAPALFERRFNQVEELFLLLDEEFRVPAFPIHHDVRRSEPELHYLASLRELLTGITARAPRLFAGLTYLFDPAEILKPCFFALHRLEDREYLYLLRLDLMVRPQVHRLLEKGANDRTPAYTTRQIFLEALLIPLEGVQTEAGRIRGFTVHQTISSTWVDETGRGYFVQGIWMDNELTKFFSRLFLPEGRRIYPYYPFVCKYRTLCQSLIRFSPESRGRELPLLHRALKFLEPHMRQIENAMRKGNFSPDNPVFQELKRQVPSSWAEAWKNLRTEAYLNDQDMKEFRIED